MNRHLKPRIIIERCHIHLLNGLRAPTLSQTVCEVPETKKNETTVCTLSRAQWEGGDRHNAVQFRTRCAVRGDRSS